MTKSAGVRSNVAIPVRSRKINKPARCISMRTARCDALAGSLNHPARLQPLRRHQFLSRSRARLVAALPALQPVRPASLVVLLLAAQQVALPGRRSTIRSWLWLVYMIELGLKKRESWDY